MYNVLIVDDEKYARLWIKNCINWNDYGFEIVGEASDGCEALEKIETLKPRLVISDMDMPEMDGPKLIEKARQMNPEILFVILSGYKEFEYMRSAIQNNALDYLLKPVKAEEIVQILHTIKSRIESADKEGEEQLKVQMLLRENKELQREKFLLSLFEDEKVFSYQDLLDKLDKMGISRTGEYYCVISMGLGEDLLKESGLESERELAPFSVMNISYEVLSMNYMAGNFFSRKNEIVGIINFDTDGREPLRRVTDICQEILDKVRQCLKIKVTIGVGDVFNDITCLSSSYRAAKMSLELRIIYGENSVLAFKNSPRNSTVEILSITEDNNFLNAIMTSNLDLCQKVLTNTFIRIKEPDVFNIETVKMVYYRFISIMLKAIYNMGITPSFMGLEEMDMFSAIKDLNSIEQIQEKLLSYVEKIIISVSDTQIIGNSAVEKAKSYIVENFMQEISLMDIANHVHVTPNYFCTLFKTQTNQNLFDYITDLRIEKAKSLMKNDTLKTYEIGKMVGYKEPKYFCRVFKKVTGLSPSNYRKILMHNII